MYIDASKEELSLPASDPLLGVLIGGFSRVVPIRPE
jgi:hypothetical protein